MSNALSKGMEIIKLLSEYGEAYIVGGAVRDSLMNRIASDIDIATNVPMDKIESLFPTHDIGKNKVFGIVVVEYKDDHFEVAQFRTDGEYSDGRRPDNVVLGVTFEEDTKRRDFTINSMGLRKDYGVIDYHNGKCDIKNQIIRTVGDPKERFAEDYLRMLRAIRFASRMDFVIENDTMEAIQELAHNITKVAQERIAKELFKMAEQTGERFAYSMELLKTSNLLKYILPEVDILDQFPHDLDTHPEGDNVWLHVLSALAVNNEADPVINMAVLLHDVGKALTHVVKDGKNTYHCHEGAGEAIVNGICDRLKIDNKTRASLVYPCVNHLKFHRLKGMRVSKLITLTDNINWDILVKVAFCDEACRGEELFSYPEWYNKISYVDFIINKYNNPVNRNNMPVDKLVSGKLVMEITGIDKPCKELGVIIKGTKQWIYDNMVDLDNMDAIRDYIKNFSLEA
jgi:tRNA nucleotidyltransferase/poly(A) polymerase